MSWKYASQPTAIERAIGGVCYLTFGLAGIIYVVVTGRHGQSEFFRFHFLQSIVLSILGLLLNWAMHIFMDIGGSILSTFAVTVSIPAIQLISLAIDTITKVAYLLLLYGMIWSFLGKYAEIPFVSNLVRRQM